MTNREEATGGSKEEPLARPVATYDVVVVGYGCAGAAAAIASAEAGAATLLVEKTNHLGGLSLVSAGYMRAACDVEGAIAYLDRLGDNRVSRDLTVALAEGMVDLPRRLTELAQAANATTFRHFGADLSPQEVADLYDWPGRDAIGWTGIDSVEGFEVYDWASASRGHLLMRVLELNVERLSIETWFGARAARLTQDDGGVTGVVIDRSGSGEICVEARGGVILATGGFEFNDQMLTDYLQVPTVSSLAHRANTGDGITMAQEIGAAMWHMWHYHGSYGYRLGDGIVGRNHIGGARRPDRIVAWIMVDQRGERFMSEMPVAAETWRDLQHFEDETGEFPRIPSWVLFDETARQLGPIGRVIHSGGEKPYVWSPDNEAEVEAGYIVRAESVEELADACGLPRASLVETIDKWNDSVRSGFDPLGRPPGTMMSFTTAPFYALQAWPICNNTQGGPRHDIYQRVLDVRGEAIDGLYAIGELGSYFGNIYLLGGNLTEAVVGGGLAAQHAHARAVAFSEDPRVADNFRPIQTDARAAATIAKTANVNDVVGDAKRLETFIRQLRHEVGRHERNENAVVTAVADVLSSYLRSDSPIALDRYPPQASHYAMYPLHVEPTGEFSVAVAVWDVGQTTPIHDHQTWGVVGIVSGAEAETRYRIGPDGRPVVETARTLREGTVEVCCTADADIHAVSCGSDIPCVGIHVYGANIGTHTRSVYDAETGQRTPFVSAWSVPAGDDSGD